MSFVIPNDADTAYKEFKLRGFLDNKELYHQYVDADHPVGNKKLYNCFIEKYYINEEGYNKLVEKYKDIPEIKSSRYNNHKSDFNDDPVICYDWFKKQPKQCEYCLITQEELYIIFTGKKDTILPLNDKFKRSSGTLEIEHKDCDNNKLIDNLTLACPLCNNAKSNLIDVESWKKLFVLPIRTYYEQLLKKPLKNIIK